MRTRIVLAIAATFLVASLQADEWQWRRIACEGQYLQSTVCPPDSEDVIYVSIPWVMSVPDSGPGVYKSTDAGLTWRNLPQSEDEDCYSLTLDPLDPNTVYCGTRTLFEHPDGWPWRSQDAGEHWERSFTKFSRYMASPWDEGTIFATDDLPCDLGYWLSRSTDDGASWIDICSGVVAMMSDNVVYHREDPLLVFAAVDFEIPDSAGLGRSCDKGSTWEIVLPGRDIPGFDQDPLDGSHWVALRLTFPGDGSEEVWFAESFDSGSTWEERLLDLDFSVRSVRRLLFDRFDPQILYMLDPVLVPGLYRSTDGGYTWSAMNEGLPPSTGTRDIFLLEERPGEILAARSDGLWKWTNQHAGERPGEMIPGALRIESVSPCPFQGMMQARMSIPKSGMVDAHVYSLQGRLMRHLFHTPLEKGMHCFAWNGRDQIDREVAPGVYVLMVRAEDTQASRRVVKLK